MLFSQFLTKGSSRRARNTCDLGASGAIRGAFKASFRVKTPICSTDYNIGYRQLEEYLENLTQAKIIEPNPPSLLSLLIKTIPEEFGTGQFHTGIQTTAVL